MGLKPNVVGEHSASWVWQERLTCASEHGVCVCALKNAKWPCLGQPSYRVWETGPELSYLLLHGFVCFSYFFFSRST